MTRRLPLTEHMKPILNEDGSVPALRHKPRLRPVASDEFPGSSCWVALGANGEFLRPHSYTAFCLEDGRYVVGHRYVWVCRYGREIPTGMVVHHRCFQKRCLNPAHLALVSFGRNSQLNNFGERCIDPSEPAA